MIRHLTRTAAAVLATGAALTLATSCLPDDPRPVLAGDSLVVETAVYAADLQTGIRNISVLGSDPCGSQQALIDAGRQHPARLVIAYTGNHYSPPFAAAERYYGYYGDGQLYANCLRAVRAAVPSSVPIVVEQALACDYGDVHGSPILNAYTRTAVLGGRYPSGVFVPRLPGWTYSTALDDRLTPGHIYRAGDGGGVLRTPDRLHLTPYGARTYAQALVADARGGTP